MDRSAIHLHAVRANHLHSATSTNHTVATRERTFVIKRESFCDLDWLNTICMMYAMRACIVMPRPLSVSQGTIIVVLYYSVQSVVSAVRKPGSPLVREFFFVQ